MTDSDVSHRSDGAVLGRIGELIEEAVDRALVDGPEFLAAGADYSVYAARLDEGGEEVVIRIPREEARAGQPTRVRRAVAALERLERCELPFEVPRLLGTVTTDEGLAVVETRMEGVELAGATSGDVDPVEVTARVAAGCHHAVDADLRRELGGPVDCRGAGLDALEVFEGEPPPVVERALEWCADHLPGEGSTRLVHGDLLAQNILVDVDAGSADVAVIDWDEVRFGDPALDVASVTRGFETVFGGGESRAELIEAYDERVEWSVSEQRVRFWELVVLAREWRRASSASRSAWLLKRIGEVVG